MEILIFDDPQVRHRTSPRHSPTKKNAPGYGCCSRRSSRPTPPPAISSCRGGGTFGAGRLNVCILFSLPPGVAHSGTQVKLADPTPYLQRFPPRYRPNRYLGLPAWCARRVDTAQCVRFFAIGVSHFSEWMCRRWVCVYCPRVPQLRREERQETLLDRDAGAGAELGRVAHIKSMGGRLIYAA